MEHFLPGESVEALWQEVWWMAEVMKVDETDESKTRYWICWPGWTSVWNGWYSPEQLRRPEEDLLGQVPQANTEELKFKVGDRVEGKWQNQWWSGVILSVDTSKLSPYKLGWPEYDSSWNQWLPSDFVKDTCVPLHRDEKDVNTDYQVGDHVEVYVDENWWSATVVMCSGATECGLHLFKVNRISEKQNDVFWLEAGQLKKMKTEAWSVDDVDNNEWQFSSPSMVECKWMGCWWTAYLLDKRKIDDKLQYYVCWPDYPTSWNEWVDADRLRKIKEQNVDLSECDDTDVTDGDESDGTLDALDCQEGDIFQFCLDKTDSSRKKKYLVEIVEISESKNRVKVKLLYKNNSLKWVKASKLIKLPDNSSDEEDSEAAEESLEFSVGDYVDAEWSGSWWPAKIIAIKPGRKKCYKIGWPGWTCDWKEWVQKDRVRVRAKQVISEDDDDGDEDVEEVSGEKVTYFSGEYVDVFSKHQWWPARIVEQDSKNTSKYYMQFPGYPDTFNLWVNSSRIRGHDLTATEE